MKRYFNLILLMILLTGGCITQKPTESLLHVDIYVDGQTKGIDVPRGITVAQAIAMAQISLGSLDRTEPNGNTEVLQPMGIRVIRVKEEFRVEKVIIPFEQKIVQTESLPENVTLLAQKGENGEMEITYRHLFEDGVEVSKTSVNEGVVIKEAIPEVMMVGVQKPFLSYDIPGRIAYILGGNAWLIDGNTSNRVLVVGSGDLDGRVFSLSEDGEWLLYTRREKSEGVINSLWAAHLVDFTKPIQLVNLKITNVIHFADWYPKPGALRVLFSTVEARATAPGWQANNNLLSVEFSASGWVSKWKTLMDVNSGGVYGWWGTVFAVSPDAGQIAYARPDSLGLVDEENGFVTLLPLIPYQTGSDWAWIPGLSWSPDGQFLYTVEHQAEDGSENKEGSPIFSLATIPVGSGGAIQLVKKSGMFAYPVTSPFQGENKQEYQIAYLQALIPEQSDTSGYRLVVIDQDGSNTVNLFPGEGEAGLDPQKAAWSPEPMPDSGSYALAIIYQGNLYIVDAALGNQQQPVIRQITGDGLVNRVVWSR